MKNIKSLLVLLMLGLFFVSCEKQPQDSEWEKYYGYTAENIAGTYTSSHITGAFDGLTPSQYCHICDDAQITVSASSGDIIEFELRCPNAGYYRVFEGKPRATDDDYIINLGGTSLDTHPTFGLTAYVYENEQGEVRFHGYAQYIEWTVVTNSYGQSEYKIKSKTNYYFDVIKN